MPHKTVRLRTWLSIYASALAILLAVSIGIFLVQGNGSLDSRDAKFSLGLNLIGSAIFALIFSSLVTWVLDRNQRENFDETLNSSANRIVASVSILRETYLPVAEFPALDTFGEDFNRSLMRSIEASKIYDFCGPSARFVAARLKRVVHCPEQIRISMIDPSLDSAVMRRAADREKWSSSAGKNISELEKLLREELLLTTVSLFDFRTTCPVQLVYTSDLVVYRMELTDDSVFFSWYHGPASSGKEMPESVQFGNSSLHYQVLRQEMSRRFEILPKKVLFDSSYTESDLLIHLKDLTGKRYLPGDLTQMRLKYDEYTKELTKFLKSLGY